MPFVLDASVLLAWLLPDERSDIAQRLLLRAAHDRPRAPSLLLLEVGNALLQAERRSRLRQATRLELLDAFTSLPIALEPISAEATLRASELASRHALTLYDASYLELAVSRDCPLATFDQALGEAARAEGVVVLDEARA
ncbi:MAG: type II toxin-antitoxin system VapC family toxin [Burkholderiaceae bacterium]|jgi:predicted nucleic acid-binding protein|nr:type II toxin-antitoxin system VapC family toxin [Burkholderiaceae bacterium]